MVDEELSFDPEDFVLIMGVPTAIFISQRGDRLMAMSMCCRHQMMWRASKSLWGCRKCKIANEEIPELAGCSEWYLNPDEYNTLDVQSWVSAWTGIEKESITVKIDDNF